MGGELVGLVGLVVFFEDLEGYRSRGASLGWGVSDGWVRVPA